MIIEVTFEQIEADMQIDFDETAVEIPIQFDSDDDFEVGFGEVTEVIPDDIPAYEGNYEVNPTFADQILDTSGLLMEEDVTIKPIPIYEVSNNAGGTTVIIGG